jgi:hypothetical protein
MFFVQLRIAHPGSYRHLGRRPRPDPQPEDDDRASRAGVGRGVPAACPWTTPSPTRLLFRRRHALRNAPPATATPTCGSPASPTRRSRFNTAWTFPLQRGVAHDTCGGRRDAAPRPRPRPGRQGRRQELRAPQPLPRPPRAGDHPPPASCGSVGPAPEPPPRHGRRTTRSPPTRSEAAPAQTGPRRFARAQRGASKGHLGGPVLGGMEVRLGGP